MMTSDRNAFVWIWLPGADEPVVAGRLVALEEGRLAFHYVRSYLAREDAVSIFPMEMPLQSGGIPPAPGLHMPGCIRDASPDAWGRRVILNRKLGLKGDAADPARLDELTYLLESGSDRTGALDFQRSGTRYVPREAGGTSLDQLVQAAEFIEKGMPLDLVLQEALQYGTSIGGARPKATIDGGGQKYIAKFASSGDLYPVVKAEYVAMRLAALCGLDVAGVSLTHALGKDVLLVERFDRTPGQTGWRRKMVVSALTLLSLDEMMARYASYEDLASFIRRHFAHETSALRELFSRLTFNILCGNTDDHARNHAVFWDGEWFRLTPAYDLCPQLRTGNEATQAMLICGEDRMSRIATCLRAAGQFLLSREEAVAIVEHQIRVILSHWEAVCDEAALGAGDRAHLWNRQFLNGFAFDGLDKEAPQLARYARAAARQELRAFPMPEAPGFGG